MRDIKFRAWNGSKYRHNVGVNENKPIRAGYQWFNNENDVHSSTLEQYTGLKDKHGVDIYEGDKLKIDDYYFCNVIWDESTAQFTVDRHVTSCFLHSTHLIEVIGNIHEHIERK